MAGWTGQWARSIACACSSTRASRSAPSCRSTRSSSDSSRRRRELTGARYAALGVIDKAGQGLERFLTTGIDAETHAAIGDLPRGRGLLGVLIREAQHAAPARHRGRPALGRLPAPPSADEDVPRRADPAPGSGLREPLPDREGGRRRLHRGGRGADAASRRPGCGRDRERAPLRVLDPVAAPARVAERDRRRARLRDRARAAARRSSPRGCASSSTRGSS